LGEGLKKRHYAAYGAGDLANSLTFGLSSSFLLSYFTDVLGITARAAGTLFLVARLWDGINDPLMGILADRLFRRRRERNRGGDKFRPYLLRGSWPVAAAAVLLFWAPPEWDMAGKLVWAYATYIFWGMTYTFVNIPYGSLAYVMTGDLVERAGLSASRGIGSLAGTLLPRVFIPPLLIRFSGGEARGYLLSAGAVSLAALVFYLLSYAFTRENPPDIPGIAPLSEKGPPGLMGNRPFLAVSLASVALQTGLMVNGAMNIYYFRENLDALGLMSWAGAAALIPAAAAAPLIPRLVRRFGMVRASAWAGFFSALSWLLLLLLPSHPLLYLGIGLGAYLLLMIPHMTVWALVSESIDWQEKRTGRRSEGTVYGAYSFVRKTGQALAGFLAGAGLGWTGYDSLLPFQTPETLEGIKFLTLGVPALCLFLAFLAYRFLWPRTNDNRSTP